MAKANSKLLCASIWQPYKFEKNRNPGKEELYYLIEAMKGKKRWAQIGENLFEFKYGGGIEITDNDNIISICTQAVEIEACHELSSSSYANEIIDNFSLPTVKTFFEGKI